MNVRSNDNSAEDKKVLIMECAMELFVKEGFQQTSMALLSKESGVATGTIYHHFKGKDDLIESTYLYVSEQMGQSLLFKENELEWSYEERFKLMWMRSYQYLVDHPKYFYFKDTLNYSPLISPDLKQKANIYFEASLALIQEGIDLGLFAQKNVEILGLWIHNTVISAVQATLFGQIDQTDDQLQHFYVMTWTGLTKTNAKIEKP